MKIAIKILEAIIALLETEDDYRGSHKAPHPGNGSPLHDLSHDKDGNEDGGAFPDDVYDPKVSAQYYGHGDAKVDNETARHISKYKGKPDKPVTMYRAVPDTVKSNEINKGDWVTISKSYAKDHGEGALNGKYKILSKTAPAKHFYGSGDSFHEYGYHPDE